LQKNPQSSVFVPFFVASTVPLVTLMVTSEDVVVVDCPLDVVVVEAADDDDEEAEVVVGSATFDVGSGVGSAFGSPDNEE